MLGRLAQLAIAKPRSVALGALIVMLIAAPVAGSATKTLIARVSDFQDPGAQSTKARDVIERAAGAEPSPGVLVYVDAPPLSAEVTAVTQKLAGDPDVAYYVTYAETRNANLVSRSGRSTVIPVGLHTNDNSSTVVNRLQRMFAKDHAVELGGSDVALSQVDEQSSQDLRFAELLVFPLLALLTLAIFRGIAVVLPLAVGGLSVVLVTAAVVAINAVDPLSIFVLNLVLGLGLGLAIDYSLFLVSRFREEIACGAEVPDAVRTTITRAGRTVLFSAMVVAVAGLSLLVFPMRFLWSLGVGGVLVAATSALVSLTLLPAMLMLLGGRIRSRVPGRGDHGRWYRLGKVIARRPGMVAVPVTAILLLVASPSLHVHWTGISASVLPRSKSARVVNDRITAEFPRLHAGPMVFAIWAPAGAGNEVEAYARRVEHVSGITSIPWISYASKGVWWLYADTSGEQVDPAAQRTLERVRTLTTPFRRVEIGGEAAEFHDLETSIGARVPFALGLLLVMTMGILWAMTESVLLPVKAFVMNVLTVGVATGVLVSVFQDGRFTGLLSYSSQGGIQSGDFIVLVALMFALSTDYGVFLLARIKEARSAGIDNREAVAVGLQRAGYIVTAAAVLLATAIGAFATSHLIFLKEIGIGAVAGLLVDAFVIRTLLVPSLMMLLGELNWWQPSSLRRLHALVKREPPLERLQPKVIPT